MLNVVDIEERFSTITEYWSPRVIGRVNDQYVKAAKLDDPHAQHRGAAGVSACSGRYIPWRSGRRSWGSEALPCTRRMGALHRIIPLALATLLVMGCRTERGRPGGSSPRLPEASTGLADAHVHLSYGSAADLDSFAAAGITLVRDCGGDFDQLLRWRREIAAGARRGPRILLAGPVLDANKPAARYRAVVATPADAERVVDSLALLGVDFIKTHSGLTPGAFFAVLRRARHHRLPVAAHLPRGVPAWTAADSGVSSIEHVAESILASPIYAGYAADVPAALDWWRSAAGESAIRRLAAQRVTVVPTLVRYEATIAGADPAVRERRRALMPELLVMTMRLHRAGVPLLAGSDLVDIPGGPAIARGTAREIELFIEAGMTPEAARASASAAALHRWFTDSRANP